MTGRRDLALCAVLACLCLQSCGTFIAITMEGDQYRDPPVFPGVRCDFHSLADAAALPFSDRPNAGCVNGILRFGFWTIDLPFSLLADLTLVPLGVGIRYVKGAFQESPREEPDAPVPAEEREGGDQS